MDPDPMVPAEEVLNFWNNYGRNSDDNRDSDEDRGNRSDEAEEVNVPEEDDKDGAEGRRIDPSTSKKKVVRNPLPKLDVERLQGPKGIQTIENYFQGFKFYGKGHEKSDLDRVMKRMEHWAHRIFPKYRFDDFIEKMEVLGTKKKVHVIIKKYRLGMLRPEGDIIDEDDEDKAERDKPETDEIVPIDEFDKLIAEQIEKQRSVTDVPTNEVDKVPAKNAGNVLGSASTAKTSELSDEIRARIERNKRIAMERKMARAKRLETERESQLLEKQNSQTGGKDIGERISKNMDHRNEASTSQHSMEIENSYKPRKTQESTKRNANKSVEEIEVSSAVKDFEKALDLASWEDSPPKHGPSIERSQEAPDSTSCVETAPSKRKSIEISGEAPDSTSCVKTPPSKRKSIEKPAEDPDKMLTHDELLMEIEGAMEAIIQKKRRSEKM